MPGFHHLAAGSAKSFGFSALTRLSHKPNGAACALKTLALSAPISTNKILLGALHSCWPPRAAPPVAKLLLSTAAGVSVSCGNPPCESHPEGSSRTVGRRTTR